MLIETFQQMVEDVDGFTPILLDLDGTILTWNKAEEKQKGYTPNEIIGQNICMFYLPEDRQINLPQKLLAEAKEKGKATNIGKRIRKNGTFFWGSIEITAIRDDKGVVIGFSNLARELKDDGEIGNFWFDNDGILHLIVTCTPQTPEEVKHFRNSIKARLHSGKICAVLDIRNSVFSEEATNYAKQDVTRIYKALAYVTDPEIDSTTARALEHVPKNIPVSTFTSRGEATKWIKKYLMLLVSVV